MAHTPHTITVKIELTPLGNAMMRMAHAYADADPVLIPDDLRQAALDIIALAQEDNP